MFLIIPAVDIQQGRAVRLYEGDPKRETVYFDDPIAAAQHWDGLGAAWLHVVDLDAALGNGDNSSQVTIIAANVNAKVEVGGGIRSVAAAREWLEVVERVVLGTVAVHEPAVVDELLRDFDPERIAVSIDARGGRVAVKGWTEMSELTVSAFARDLAERGLTQLIYTDVARDGTMLGVDAEPIARLRDAFPGSLVAGGGVATDADVELYEKLGLQGAIVGRALYEGKVNYPRTA